MKSEKWMQIWLDENHEFYKVHDGHEPTPKTWPKLKEGLQVMIKNMDEATEVYNLENTPKKVK